eukprot:jgi/Mesvir1/7168/Mv02528-RA.1
MLPLQATGVHHGWCSTSSGNVLLRGGSFIHGGLSSRLKRVTTPACLKYGHRLHPSIPESPAPRIRPCCSLQPPWPECPVEPRARGHRNHVFYGVARSNKQGAKLARVLLALLVAAAGALSLPGSAVAASASTQSASVAVAEPCLTPPPAGLPATAAIATGGCVAPPSARPVAPRAPSRSPFLPSRLRSFRHWATYKVDRMLERHPQIYYYFLVAGVASVLLGGGLAYYTLNKDTRPNYSLPEAVWHAWGCMLNPTAHLGESTATNRLLAWTLCTVGVFFYSLLTSAIAVGLRTRVDNIRAGAAANVVESGHILIVGTNEHLQPLLEQIRVAHECHRREYVAAAPNPVARLLREADVCLPRVPRALWGLNVALPVGSFGKGRISTAAPLSGGDSLGNRGGDRGGNPGAADAGFWGEGKVTGSGSSSKASSSGSSNALFRNAPLSKINIDDVRFKDGAFGDDDGYHVPRIQEVVVLADKPKSQIEALVGREGTRSRLFNVTCRSGNPADWYTYRRVSARDAKAVVLLGQASGKRGDSVALLHLLALQREGKTPLGEEWGVDGVGAGATGLANGGEVGTGAGSQYGGGWQADAGGHCGLEDGVDASGAAQGYGGVYMNGSHTVGQADPGAQSTMGGASYTGHQAKTWGQVYVGGQPHTGNGHPHPPIGGQVNRVMVGHPHSPTGAREVIVQVSKPSSSELLRSIGGRSMRVSGVQDLSPKLFVQCARQQGLADVLKELLSHRGDVINVRAYPELIGCRYGDLRRGLDEAVLCGLVSPRAGYEEEDGLDVRFLPEDAHVITERDRLLVISHKGSLRKLPSSLTKVRAGGPSSTPSSDAVNLLYSSSSSSSSFSSSSSSTSSLSYPSSSSGAAAASTPAACAPMEHLASPQDNPLKQQGDKLVLPVNINPVVAASEAASGSASNHTALGLPSVPPPPHTAGYGMPHPQPQHHCHMEETVSINAAAAALSMSSADASIRHPSRDASQPHPHNSLHHHHHHHHPHGQQLHQHHGHDHPTLNSGLGPSRSHSHETRPAGYMMGTQGPAGLNNNDSRTISGPAGTAVPRKSSVPWSSSGAVQRPELIVICGWSSCVPDVISELDAYCAPGSHVVVLDETPAWQRQRVLARRVAGQLVNLSVTHKEGRVMSRTDMTDAIIGTLRRHRAAVAAAGNAASMSPSVSPLLSSSGPSSSMASENAWRGGGGGGWVGLGGKESAAGKVAWSSPLTASTFSVTSASPLSISSPHATSSPLPHWPPSGASLASSTSPSSSSLPMNSHAHLQALSPVTMGSHSEKAATTQALGTASRAIRDGGSSGGGGSSTQGNTVARGSSIVTAVSMTGTEGPRRSDALASMGSHPGASMGSHPIASLGNLYHQDLDVSVFVVAGEDPFTKGEASSDVDRVAVYAVLQAEEICRQHGVRPRNLVAELVDDKIGMQVLLNAAPLRGGYGGSGGGGDGGGGGGGGGSGQLAGAHGQHPRVAFVSTSEVMALFTSQVGERGLFGCCSPLVVGGVSSMVVRHVFGFARQPPLTVGCR